MKFLHLLLISFALSQPAAPQSDDQRVLSAKFKNKALGVVLDELQERYGTEFSYLDQVVENKYVSAQLQAATLEQALGEILRGTNLTFRVFGAENVVIFRRKPEETFVLSGHVTDSASKRGVPFANVTIPSLGVGDVADTSGYYEISRLPPDTYDVKFQLIGYEQIAKRIHLHANTSADIVLKIQPLQLQAVEITPGIINIGEREAGVTTLTSEEILASPNFIRDVNRAIQVLPSVVNTDIRARPHIKGGHPDETAIVLDNMEILEPYHLYDSYDGPGGIINTETIKNIKLLTGGFSAKYTDKLSGIIEIKSLTADDYEHTVNFAIDFLGAGLLLRKKFSKVNYVLNARRAYIDLISDDLDEIKSPIVYDVWSKIDFRINARNQLSFNFLFSANDEGYEDPQALLRPEYFHSKRRNLYGWIYWKSLLSNSLHSTWTVGLQSLSKEADFKFESTLSDGNLDRRQNEVLIVKQHSALEASDRHSLEMGFELKHFRSHYEFNEIRTNHYLTTANHVVIDSIRVDSEFSAHTVSGYVQDTWHISESLKLLFGLKVASQSFTGGPQVAPRTSFSYNVTEDLNFKAAYGWYYQPDNLQKLRSYEGQSFPSETVAKNVQYLAELSYRIADNTNLRLDAYYKDYKSLPGDYEFDFVNRRDEAYILDRPFKPVSAYSSGFEASLRHGFGNDNLLSIAYAHNVNRIKNAEGLIAPRDYDRPHTLILNSIFNLGRGFSLGALWRFHSGFPYTPTLLRTIGDNSIGGDTVIYYEFGEKNSSRLPVYHTFDIRFQKNWRLKDSSLKLYLNIINLYNRQNIRSYEWNNAVHQDGRVVLWDIRDTGFLDRFVSFGLGVSF